MQYITALLPKGTLVEFSNYCKFGYTGEDYYVIMFDSNIVDYIVSKVEDASMNTINNDSIIYRKSFKILNAKNRLKCVYNELFYIARPYMIYINAKQDYWNSYELSLTKDEYTILGVMVQGTLDSISGPSHIVFRYINKKVYRSIPCMKQFRDVSFMYR